MNTQSRTGRPSPESGPEPGVVQQFYQEAVVTLKTDVHPNGEEPRMEMTTDMRADVGVVRELGELPPHTVVSEEALAKMFRRHRASIKRAVERGELPPSVRLFGEPVWTVQSLRDHMNRRLEAAKKEAEQLQRRISQISA